MKFRRIEHREAYRFALTFENGARREVDLRKTSHTLGRARANEFAPTPISTERVFIGVSADDYKNEDDLGQTLYEDFIIEQRQAGAISLSKAAELLDVSYEDFFALLGRKGLSFINASPEETDDSYRAFADLTSQR